jgi:fructokinase
VDLFILGDNGARLKAEAAGGSRSMSRSGFPGWAALGALHRSSTTLRPAAHDLLMTENVNLDYAMRTPRLTTISVVATDAGGQPQYSFHGEGAADRSITVADLKPELAADIEAVTFGSYTLIVQPVAEAYLALAQREAGQRVIFLDPTSGRPSSAI